MVIKDSSISMSSFHAKEKTSITSFSSRLYQNNTKDSVNGRGEEEARLTLSNRGKHLLENLRQKLKQLQDDEAKPGDIEELSPKPEKSKDELNLEVLKRILEMLKRIREGKSNIEQTIGVESSTMESKSVGLTLDLRGPISIANNTGNVWTRQTVYSGFTAEHEVMAFTSDGTVTTDDGRNINFNISLGMSRSFVESTNYIKEETIQILTDPLVINMNTNTANVTDQKFLFDLDSDGEKESISFLQEGSGFLALDKNQDGIVNDGSELFGTKSGDGFKDLAEYDIDQNNWIDENDDVYNQLRVWTKREDGEDQLLNLKEADVGAIFLGHASTEFSLNDATTNQTNAKIQSTGIYLKESGEVATVQHVDLAL